MKSMLIGALIRTRTLEAIEVQTLINTTHPNRRSMARSSRLPDIKIRDTYGPQNA
jgi:hypothetical protein